MSLVEEASETAIPLKYLLDFTHVSTCQKMHPLQCHLIIKCFCTGGVTMNEFYNIEFIFHTMKLSLTVWKKRVWNCLRWKQNIWNVLYVSNFFEAFCSWKLVRCKWAWRLIKDTGFAIFRFTSSWLLCRTSLSDVTKQYVLKRKRQSDYVVFIVIWYLNHLTIYLLFLNYFLSISITLMKIHSSEIANK